MDNLFVNDINICSGYDIENNNKQCKNYRINTSYFCKIHSDIANDIHKAYKGYNMKIEHLSNKKDIYDLLKIHCYLGKEYELRLKYKNMFYVKELSDEGHNFAIDFTLDKVKHYESIINKYFIDKKKEKEDNLKVENLKVETNNELNNINIKDINNVIERSNTNNVKYIKYNTIKDKINDDKNALIEIDNIINNKKIEKNHMLKLMDNFYNSCIDEVFGENNKCYLPIKVKKEDLLYLNEINHLRQENEDYLGLDTNLYIKTIIKMPILNMIYNSIYSLFIYNINLTRSQSKICRIKFINQICRDFIPLFSLEKIKKYYEFSLKEKKHIMHCLKLIKENSLFSIDEELPNEWPIFSVITINLDKYILMLKEEELNDIYNVFKELSDHKQLFTKSKSIDKLFAKKSMLDCYEKVDNIKKTYDY
jgi:hypothetical protein